MSNQNRAIPSKPAKTFPKKDQKQVQGRAAPKPKEVPPNDKHDRSLWGQDEAQPRFGEAMEKRLIAKRKMTRT